MNDIEFALKYDKIIEGIAKVVEDSDPMGKIDVDLNDGILAIATDSGTFVINKQSSTKEIWLSSPITGPYHFSYNNNKWIARNGAELFNIINAELNITLDEATCLALI